MKERVQHVDRSLTMGNMVGFISSHASNQQIAYSYSPRNNTGCDAILCHIMLDWCRLWTSQPHWGRNKPKKQKAEIGSLCKLKPSQMQHSQSQDLSEEEEGSLLAWCCWTGLWRAGEEAGHSPRNILSLQREQGIHIYHSVGSHAQALPLDINICMTCADMRDPIISHSNSS